MSLQRRERCNIKYRAFHITDRVKREHNWRNSIFTHHRQVEQEEIEKLLNKTTGDAVYRKTAFYYVSGRKWVDLSYVDSVDSWGRPICYETIHFYRDLKDQEKSKSNNKKKIGLQTVRDFIDEFGYYIPQYAGERVQNDVKRVMLMRKRKERVIEKKNQNTIKCTKKELKTEWDFLNNIYNDTSIFGYKKHYKNFVDSNTRTGPIFKCMCSYHSRYN